MLNAIDGSSVVDYWVLDPHGGGWCSQDAFVVVVVVVVISTVSVIGKIEFVAVVPFVFLAIVPKAGIKKG